MKYKPIRLLVVDDSAIIRRAIEMMVEETPDMEVCGSAHDGVEALDKIEQLKPDVVTLDLEMPRMGGLEVLEKLGPDNDVPVLVLSRLTFDNAEETFRALELGAVDYLFKGDGQSTAIIHLQEELLTKVKAIGSRYRRHHVSHTSRRPVTRKTEPVLEQRPRKMKSSHFGLVAIGASTGGPSLLIDMFSNLGPAPGVAFLIVQHMPKLFTPMLAKRLDEVSGISFAEASGAETLKPGTGRVAPGGADLVIKPGGRLSVFHGEEGNPNHPNINVALESVAVSYGPRALGILLTGMGHDGAAGLKKMREAKCETWVQKRSTCVVDGMPKSAIEIGAAAHELTPDELRLGLEAVVTAAR